MLLLASLCNTYIGFSPDIRLYYYLVVYSLNDDDSAASAGKSRQEI